MKIFFEQKKPGRTRPEVQPVAMDISGIPSTTGGLIEATVRKVVEAFNRRVAGRASDIDADNGGCVLSDDAVEALVAVGRVSFGVVYNEQSVDPDDAVATALQCYEDGMFRMFVNGKDTGPVDTALDLHEGDTVTVVRLTLLAGRMW